MELSAEQFAIEYYQVAKSKVQSVSLTSAIKFAERYNERCNQSKTIDKLKLISTLANFQEQKRIAMDVLSNAHQLIAGWKGTTPKEEWSDFDEKTLQSISDLMASIEKSLPSVGTK